jgi:hypothetical protein
VKSLFVSILILLSVYALGQNVSTPVDVSLYLPADLSNDLKPQDTLKVFTLIMGKTGPEAKGFIIAEKISRNVYRINLPMEIFAFIGFSIGIYSGRKHCVYNEDGKAGERDNFIILLEDIKTDFQGRLFLPPCVQGE